MNKKRCSCERSSLRVLIITCVYCETFNCNKCADIDEIRNIIFCKTCANKLIRGEG